MATRFKHNHFLFWQRWLFYTSLLFAFYGIVFAFYGKNILFLPYDKMLAKVFWNSSQFPPEADSFRAFIYGPLGGTITCCYIWKDFSTSQDLNKKLL